jgi:hypothetical protein
MHRVYPKCTAGEKPALPARIQRVLSPKTETESILLITFSIPLQRSQLGPCHLNMCYKPMFMAWHQQPAGAVKQLYDRTAAASRTPQQACLMTWSAAVAVWHT